MQEYNKNIVVLFVNYMVVQSSNWPNSAIANQSLVYMVHWPAARYSAMKIFSLPILCLVVLSLTSTTSASAKGIVFEDATPRSGTDVKAARDKLWAESTDYDFLLDNDINISKQMYAEKQVQLEQLVNEAGETMSTVENLMGMTNGKPNQTKNQMRQNVFELAGKLRDRAKIVPLAATTMGPSVNTTVDDIKGIAQGEGTRQSETNVDDSLEKQPKLAGSTVVVTESTTTLNEATEDHTDIQLSEPLATTSLASTDMHTTDIAKFTDTEEILAEKDANNDLAHSHSDSDTDSQASTISTITADSIIRPPDETTTTTIEATVFSSQDGEMRDPKMAENIQDDADKRQKPNVKTVVRRQTLKLKPKGQVTRPKWVGDSDAPRTTEDGKDVSMDTQMQEAIRMAIFNSNKGNKDELYARVYSATGDGLKQLYKQYYPDAPLPTPAVSDVLDEKSTTDTSVSAQSAMMTTFADKYISASAGLKKSIRSEAASFMATANVADSMYELDKLVTLAKKQLTNRKTTVSKGGVSPNAQNARIMDQLWTEYKTLEREAALATGDAGDVAVDDIEQSKLPPQVLIASVIQLSHFVEKEKGKLVKEILKRRPVDENVSNDSALDITRREKLMELPIIELQQGQAALQKIEIARTED